MRLGFVTLRPEHQHLDRGAYIRSAVQDRGHLGRNREFDSMPRTQGKRHAGRLHAFGDHFHARENFMQLTAARQFDADVTISAERSRARAGS